MGMTTLEVGKKLVELCQQQKSLEAIDTLYANEIVSIEANDMPGMPAKMSGKATVRGKTVWWLENFQVHAHEELGPYVNGDRFAVYFKYDVTEKAKGQRMNMIEMALYTVKNGLIVQEEFFYDTGGK